MRRRLLLERLEMRLTMDGSGDVLPLAEGEGELVFTFDYEDINPASPHFGEIISPRSYLSQVSAWYFGQATCDFCRSQFARLDSLQQDLDAAHPILSIGVFGVNEVGHESDNGLMTAGTSLPWLQDVDADNNQFSDVWHDLWAVSDLDVVILDGENRIVEVFNLAANELSESGNYDALRTKLIDAAMAEQKPWSNSRDPYDVNDDGHVVPLDALIQINSINAEGARRLPPPTGTEISAFYDSSGDGWLSSIDSLQVINRIAEIAAGGEGEGLLPRARTTAPVPLPQTPAEQAANAGNERDSIGDAVPETSADVDPIVAARPTNASGTRTERAKSDVEADDYWERYWITPSEPRHPRGALALQLQSPT